MIEEYLQRNPVMFLSGGMDSLVVLNRIRKVKDIPCITFNEGFTPKQWAIIDNIIRLWNLEVYTMPPARSYLIPNARVDEYGLGDITFPVIRDIIDGECHHDNRTIDAVPFPYDVVFTGSRQSDESFATGKSPFKGEVVEFGGVTFVQPLFYMTDDEVRNEAKGLPYSKEWYEGGDESFDTGNIECNCSSSDIWENLAMFRRKFQFEV